jgi:hypothetical protein
MSCFRLVVFVHLVQRDDYSYLEENTHIHYSITYIESCDNIPRGTGITFLLTYCRSYEYLLKIGVCQVRVTVRRDTYVQSSSYSSLA